MSAGKRSTGGKGFVISKDGILEQALRQPGADAQFLAAHLNGLASLLQGVSNQLDLLIRLECGSRSREEVRRKIDEFDAEKAAEAAALAQEAAAEKDKWKGQMERTNRNRKDQ